MGQAAGQREFLRLLLGLNVILFFGGIATSAPVVGFRPLRALLCLTSKLPNPEKVTFPPFFRVPLTPPRSDENALAAWRAVIPASLDIRMMVSFLFISNLLLPCATKSLGRLTFMLKRRQEAVKSSEINLLTAHKPLSIMKKPIRRP